MPTFEFEFIVEGPPYTANNNDQKKKSEWKQSVGKAAYAKWIADGRSESILPLRIRLEVYVTTYCRSILYDVDNILKWTLDGLKPENESEIPYNMNAKPKKSRRKKSAERYEAIYADDQLIFKVTSERIELNKEELILPSPLLDQASQDFREFLHIVIRWKEREEDNNANSTTNNT